MERETYEQGLARRRAQQQAQERPRRPLSLADFFRPLPEVGVGPRHRDSPQREYRGWVRESDALMVWEEGV